MKQHARKHALPRAVRLAALFVCVAALLAGCARGAVPQTASNFAMGSLIEVKAYPAGALPEGFTQALFSAAQALDGAISATAPEAQIARLNAAGTGTCGADTLNVLRTSLGLCVALDGRLDITLGAVTELWGFTGDSPRVPEETALREALATKGVEKVRAEGASVSLAPGQKLDLGAVGKGAGCDAMLDILKQYGVPAVVSFGGTVLVYGEAPAGAWRVGIRDPQGGASDTLGTLEFSPAADGAYFVSTSGGYEKTFTENGETYHHILDPDTGYPVRGPLASVTAVGENGLVCDALSTALFVNGCNETSLRWVETYLTGAVFTFADGGVFVTDGLASAFALTNTAAFRALTAEEAFAQ